MKGKNAQEEINNTSQMKNYKYRLENSITDSDSKIIILNANKFCETEHYSSYKSKGWSR